MLQSRALTLTCLMLVLVACGGEAPETSQEPVAIADSSASAAQNDPSSSAESGTPADTAEELPPTETATPAGPEEKPRPAGAATPAKPEENALPPEPATPEEPMQEPSPVESPPVAPAESPRPASPPEAAPSVGGSARPEPEAEATPSAEPARPEPSAAVVDPGGIVAVAAPKPGLEPIGAAKCKLCHKVQYNSWVETAHAKREPPLDCEICHGPGSEYKKLAVMKDPEQSRAAGLVDPDREFCATCHKSGWSDDMLQRTHEHKET